MLHFRLLFQIFHGGICETCPQLAAADKHFKLARSTMLEFDLTQQRHLLLSMVVIVEITTPLGSSRCNEKETQYEKICYDLPPIRHLGRGIPTSCKCVTLDGNLYVLGGAGGKKLHVGSKRVYRLDLAGHAKQWQRCPDMDEPRLKFGAGVIDGKIYVLGGISRGIPVFESEMYDPKVNAWYPIKPMPSLRFDHQVTRVGDKLFVHGGHFFSGQWLKSRDLMEHIRLASDCTEDACHGRHSAGYIDFSRALEICDPITDQWRSLGRDVQSFLDRQCSILFTEEGTLHSLGTGKGIRVLDLDEKLAKPLHSLQPFQEWVWCLNYFFYPIAAVAADDDILLAGTYTNNLLDGSDEDELSVN